MLEIAKVWLRREWVGGLFLGDAAAVAITPALDPAGRATGNPNRLASVAGRSFQGSNVLGLGFVIRPEEAQALIARDVRNADVLFPFIGGEDLNSSPTHSTPRWIINFFDWPLERAAAYPDCLSIVEAKVRPERELNRYSAHAREHWWQYERPRMEMYSSIASFQRVLVIAQVSRTLQPAFVPNGQVYSHKLVVFAYEDFFHFGILASDFHRCWALKYTSTMRTDTSYSPSDVFETFPQPAYDAGIEAAAKALDELRSGLMVRNNEGLTKTYNRVHDPSDDSPGVPELRELHVALDVAGRDAYAWSDLDLEHGFHDTPQGRRFTLGPAARAEVLDRLLELNHQRYAEEVAAGLHDKKKSAGRGRRRPSDAPTLL